jgi:hypothetical protein
MMSTPRNLVGYQQLLIGRFLAQTGEITDTLRLDGLNKEMGSFELQYYMHILKQNCTAQKLACLNYPHRPFIAQIARFE